MNNTIMRKITLTASYAALASTKTVASVTISAPLSNAAVAYFEGDTSDDVEIHPGEWFRFESVNLAEMQVKGASGDILTVIGGTW